MMSEINNLL